MTGDKDKDAGIIRSKKTPAHAGLVLLHGYGASGDDLVPLGEHFAHACEHLDVWVPEGPEACESGYGGRQWFSLRYADLESGIFSEELWTAIDRAALFVLKGIEQRFPADLPVFVSGFSQGGALATHIGLCHRKVEGVLSFSGFYQLEEKRVRFRPNILWCHGTHDTVVPISALTSFRHQYPTVEAVTLQGAGHSIPDEAVRRGVSFIAHHWPKR